MSERVIIKLGGSVLSPYEDAQAAVQSGQVPFDFAYAKQILNNLKSTNKEFVIIIGGGFLNRWYLRDLKKKGYDMPESQTDFHHVGIAASIINATIFRMLAAEIFGEENVYPEVIKYHEYDSLLENRAKLQQAQVIIGAGKKVGHSTDVDALLFAAFFGTNQVISLKNIDGIYSADPHEHPEAEKRKVMNWTEYKTIIKATAHAPGASFPIDAIAAQVAQKMKIGFTVINGRDFDAVNEVVKTRLSSKGSVITPE